MLTPEDVDIPNSGRDDYYPRRDYVPHYHCVASGSIVAVYTTADPVMRAATKRVDGCERAVRDALEELAAHAKAQERSTC